MAARQPPFAGETESHVMVAILEQAPQPLPASNRPLPGGLANIITRALSKDRAKRYQSAREMLADLQQVAQTAGLASSIRPVAPAAPRQVTRRFTIIAAICVILAIAVAAWFWITRSPDWFRIGSVRQLTFNGRTKLAAISPDGKYLAFVVGDTGGLEGLYLKQVDQASEQMKIPARKITYEGLTFSPDSQTIFEAEKDEKFMGRLYAVPILGDRPASPIVVDVDGPISFSPRGDQFSFVRFAADSTSTSLEIAAHDGSGVKPLVSVRGTALSIWQAWSPKGNQIATFLYTYGNGETALDLVSMQGQETKRVLPNWRGVRQPVWTSASTLLVPVAVRSQGGNQTQLKEIAVKDGQIHDLTIDLAGYTSASLTRDGQSLAAVKMETKANLWISGRSDPTTGQSAPAEAGDKPALSWSDDQHLVVSSGRSGFPNLALFDVASQDRASLTDEPYAEIGAAAVPASKSVVFGSTRRGGFHLWKFNPESAVYTQLTSGPTYDETPAITPDGKWIVYTSSRANLPHLRKISIDGGPSTQIGAYLARYPEISPDGKWIACELQDPKTRRWTVAVIPFSGQGTAREVPNAHIPVRWSPDGSSLTSVVTNERGVSNLWSIPLDGSPPRQLTHFEDQTILTFAWSPRGDRLACIRGSRGADVYLFKRQK
jgi:Tol biopolymer transport system component